MTVIIVNVLFLVWVLLCSPHCAGTLYVDHGDPVASISQVLGLKVCITTPSHTLLSGFLLKTGITICYLSDYIHVHPCQPTHQITLTEVLFYCGPTCRLQTFIKVKGQ